MFDINGKRVIDQGPATIGIIKKAGLTLSAYSVKENEPIVKKNEPIAERVIYGIDTDGNGFDIGLLVGQPYERETGEWACPVAAIGLNFPLREIVGVDSWQALNLGLRLMRTIVGLFVESGGKLYWAKGDRQLSLDELFWPEPKTEAEIPQADDPISDEAQIRVDALSEAELKSIDDAIIAGSSTQWRKVARVVATAMETVGSKGIPDGFYAQRVYRLVVAGKLESQGKLGYMRFCEVRLAGTETATTG